MNALILATLLAATPVSKVELATKPMEALGGRLTLRLPEGTTAEARGHSLMAPDHPEENESRFVFEQDNVRVVVMVNDLFATATNGTLVAMTKKDLARDPKNTAHVEPLTLSGFSSAARMVLPKPQCDEDGCLVAGAWTVSGEGEVEYAAVYTNEAGAEDPKAISALADKILGSIAPGARTLPLSGGERSLLGFGEKGALAITLPANAAVSIERGPDFDVVRIHLLRALDQPAATLGIYVGGFPSFHPPKSAPSRSETILGVKTSWFASSHERDGIRLSGEEALVRFPDEDDAPFLHLFLNGDAAALPALQGLASSLHFAAKPEAPKKTKKK